MILKNLFCYFVKDDCFQMSSLVPADSEGIKPNTSSMIGSTCMCAWPHAYIPYPFSEPDLISSRRRSPALR